MEEQKLQLLSDDQVRRFVADGFIFINPNLAASFNAEVSQQIAYALEYELPHPGDNILARVPALNAVCQSPAVKGALSSLLGNQFVFLPHRFPHNSEPLGSVVDNEPNQRGSGDPVYSKTQQINAFESQPEMAKGSISASVWHQDSHAFCGRTRWHTVRAANVFYFPHETPLHMGPTRFLAGSHLYATLHDLCPEQAVMQAIPAGTVVIAHFDLAHAGSPNNSDVGRYMMKFVAIRTEDPLAATWNHKDAQWKTPDDLFTHHHLPVVWNSLWNWLRGADRNEGYSGLKKDAVDVRSSIEGMKSRSQQERLSNLYELAAVGAPAVDGLVQALLQTSGGVRKKIRLGKAVGGGSAHHLDRFFSDGQFVPEDFAIALGAIGLPALDALIELLDHDEPWIRMNAVYALGDAGPNVARGVMPQISQLLFDNEASVIRVTLDAIAALGILEAPTAERLRQFIERQVPEWGAATGMDLRLAMLEQIRYLSVIAMLSWASDVECKESQFLSLVEAALLHGLKDENGYPPRLACLALERCGSVESLHAVIQYLRGRSWDAEQNTRAVGAWTLAHRSSTLARLNTQVDNQADA